MIRITSITGERRSTGGIVLSRTVIIHAVVKPVRRNNGELVTLSASTDLDHEVAMQTSRSGSVAFVLDTTLLDNGVCDITVRDLRGHTDTRRVRIDNPLSQTGHFYYRDESRPIPQLSGMARNAPFHSSEYYSFFPIICSDTENFQINFSTAHPGVFPVEIRDRQDNLVQHLSIRAENASQQGGQERGQHHCYASTEWDGKNTRGRAAPQGDYLVQATLPNQPGAVQLLGIIHKTTGATPVKPCLPVVQHAELRFVDLKEGATLVGDVLVQVVSSHSDPVMLLLDGKLVATSMPIRGYQRVPLPLNTARYANGKHVLEVRDFHGHYARLSVVFQNPVAQVHYEPDFDLNTGGMGPRLSYFTATLPQPRLWKVVLLNDKGQTVKSFKGNSKTILLAWDGNDDRGKRVPLGRHEILLRVGSSSASDTTLGFIDLHISEE